MAKPGKTSNIMNDIKNSIKKSGTNKSKLLYFKSGTKMRVRFLQEMSQGIKLMFHDSYTMGINVPCQEYFDRECNYCGRDDLRHREQYIWCVYDYESKEVKLLMAPVNNCSPVPVLYGMFETYKTIMDRDYVITQNGAGQSKSFSVVPMDKVKFKNDKAKPFSESKILDILDKAFPDDNEESAEDDDEDEDEDLTPKNKKKNDKNKKKTRKEEPEEDDEDEADDEEENDDEDEENDYESMSAKELFKLCTKREIKVKPKKDKEYYIEKLEQYDEENEDSDDEEDEEDEW